MPPMSLQALLVLLCAACGVQSSETLAIPAAPSAATPTARQAPAPGQDPTPREDPPRSAEPRKAFTEGRDYQVLERVRLIDAHGFGQPVEAASFLLPRGWKLEGGVTWRVGHPCMAEAVAVRYTARSADGQLQMDGFPVRAWQWADDPTMRQSMIANQQGYGRTCDVLPPFDAAEFTRQLVLPELGNPTVVSLTREDSLAQAMEERARRNQAALLAQGLGNVAFRPSAVKAHLRWSDGSEGTLLASVDQTVMYMQDFLRGGTSGNYSCQSEFRLVMRYPPARREEAERILSGAIASARVNPSWQQAVAQVFSNVAQVERAEIAKRAGLWREANEHIQRSQRRTWEDAQESRDRVSAQWGRVIRGVDEWRDPYGSAVELSAGYGQGWSRADGTYILSNDPLFDPNVVFQEEWRVMHKRP